LTSVPRRSPGCGRALVHRSGLRADILEDGEISVGDRNAAIR